MFRARVLNAVKRIPPGRVATYGDVAAAAGNARACRAVGNIMRECSAPGIPCHRVIAAGGKLGGYGGNLELKRALLRAEGVRVVGSAIRGFSEIRWPSPKKTNSLPGRSAEHDRAARRRANAEATRGRHGAV